MHGEADGLQKHLTVAKSLTHHVGYTPRELVFSRDKFGEYPTDPASVDVGFGDYPRRFQCPVIPADLASLGMGLETRGWSFQTGFHRQGPNGARLRWKLLQRQHLACSTAKRFNSKAQGRAAHPGLAGNEFSAP